MSLESLESAASLPPAMYQFITVNLIKVQNSPRVPNCWRVCLVAVSRKRRCHLPNHLEMHEQKSGVPRSCTKVQKQGIFLVGLWTSQSLIIMISWLKNWNVCLISTVNSRPLIRIIG